MAGDRRWVLQLQKRKGVGMVPLPHGDEKGGEDEAEKKVDAGDRGLKMTATTLG
jgi:hypothetical protein